MIDATCATLVALITAAEPGSTIRLAEDCIEQSFIVRTTKGPSRLELNGRIGRLEWRANSANGWTITGHGVIGFRGARTGLQVRGGDGVVVDGLRFVESDIGLSCSGCRDVVLRNLDIVAEVDGLVTPDSSGAVENVTVTLPTISYTSCLLPDGTVVSGLSQRECQSRNGQWRDGPHRDGWQVEFNDTPVEQRVGPWVVRNFRSWGYGRCIAGPLHGPAIRMEGVWCSTHFDFGIDVRRADVVIENLWMERLVDPNGILRPNDPRLNVGDGSTVCGVRWVNYPTPPAEYPKCPLRLFVPDDVERVILSVPGPAAVEVVRR